eukprot:1212936-Rhodomonas_salina.1
MSNAFFRWSESMLELKRLRLVSGKVLRRMASARLAKAMAKWISRSADGERNRDLGRVSVKIWTGQAAGKALKRWRENASEIQRHRDRMRMVLRRLAKLKAWMALEQWRSWVLEEVRGRRTMDKVVLRWWTKLVVAALSTWQAAAQENKRVRLLLSRVSLRWRSLLTHAAVVTWQAAAKEQIRMKSVVSQADSRWKNSAIFAAFETWSCASKDTVANRAKLSQCLQRVRSLCLGRAFNMFREITMKQTVVKKVGDVVLLKMLISSLRTFFTAWEEVWAAQASKIILWFRFCSKAIIRIQQARATYVLTQRRYKRLRRICSGREWKRNRELVLSAVGFWKDCARGQRLLKRALTKWIKTQQVAGFFGWKEKAETLRQQRRAVHRVVTRMMQMQ